MPLSYTPDSGPKLFSRAEDAVSAVRTTLIALLTTGALAYACEEITGGWGPGHPAPDAPARQTLQPPASVNEK